MTTKETIEKIHHEFNSAGEELLIEVKDYLKQLDNKIIDKGKRLALAGFKSAKEADAYLSQEVNISGAKSIADLIEYYSVRYPLNKFINEEQVKKICDKYNLACAPIERYKGFVPEKNLLEFEKFNLDKRDMAPNLIKITGAWNTGVSDFMLRGRGASAIHKRLGLDLIPSNHPDLYWMGGKLFSCEPGYVSGYKVYDKQSILICAPKKEINLLGLKRIGAIFTSTIVQPKSYPDPVILLPVNGGYLIITAWGDESNDENVVNPIKN